MLDCLKGLHKARACNFFDFDTFDLNEYEHFEAVEHGDLNWLVYGRFFAFAGPHDAHRNPHTGYETLAPEDYVPYFKSRNVSLIVRLNKPYYDRQKFLKNGIDHVDMYYLDGSNPPIKILRKFLEVCEQTPGAIGVHCKAGLGRTGTCIGCYCMKHHKFTAAEIIAWFRICRPGSVIGPQQQFILDAEDRQMLLLRSGRKVVPLAQSGVPIHRRFSFYDQVHSTGMDIKQTPSARAALTLSKDMTFRDYAQGAYRMRGIGKGQTVELLAPPAVLGLVARDAALGAAKPARARAVEEKALPSEARARRPLRDIVAWLHVNSMHSETLQFNLLCEQSVRNVWRKRAFRTLGG